MSLHTGIINPNPWNYDRAHVCFMKPPVLFQFQRETKLVLFSTAAEEQHK